MTTEQTCPLCGGPLLPLLTGVYCPADCDKHPDHPGRITQELKLPDDWVVEWDPPDEEETQP